jgi:deoxycytidine triphosphate deaminase
MQINPKEVIKNKWLIGDDDFVIQQVGIDLKLTEEFILPPKGYHNCTLQGKISLPSDVFANLFVRSSYSRKGLFISSGVYDPGYGKDEPAPLGCTFYNMTDNPVTMREGDRICQVVFFKADASSDYCGYYNTTKEVESKLEKKIEIDKSKDLSREDMEVRLSQLAHFSVERNKRYGNSMVFLSNRDIMKLCMTKLTRSITLLKDKNNKLVDEIIDTINYLVFVLIRVDSIYKNIDFRDPYTGKFEDCYQASLDKEFITYDKYMNVVKKDLWTQIVTADSTLNPSDWVYKLCNDLFGAIQNISCITTRDLQKIIVSLLILWKRVNPESFYERI